MSKGTHAKRLALFLPDMRGGGAERVALALAHGFLDGGYEVDLVLAQAVGELLPLLRPEVHVVDLAAPRFRYALRPLIRYLRERRPAAMQALMYPLPLLALAARRLSGVPARIVAAEHTTLSRAPRSAVGRLLAPRLIHAAYPHADAITIVSAGAADDLAQYADLPRERITVIHNPLDLPPLPLDSKGKEACWPTATGRILAVGTLKPEKNLPLLLRALKQVAETREASLVIVGDGPERARLEALARTEGLADKVKFAGFQVDPWPFYAAADLFVLSSNYEGFGNVIVEALHARLPVVSTECPSGPSEILEGGRLGRLVPVDDSAAMASAILEAVGANRRAGSFLLPETSTFSINDNHSVRQYLQVSLGNHLKECF